ncbi:MAG TPA: 4-hydroxy-tetrahydrodipicolinate reductase, partial [bacterium]|nr:4-hydroxy-tetrahydrodipicolinate reductase [bacterium]
IPVLHTSNLSKGVNILFEIMKKAAALTGDADIEIVETHHNKKKDAPSGTALELGKIISSEQSTRKLKPVEGRSGIKGERASNEIGYHSIRCGDVPGEHTVIFGFQGERIEITHRALTRDIFATGAIEAALFLAGKKPGKYSMKDVIGSRS